MLAVQKTEKFKIKHLKKNFIYSRNLIREEFLKDNKSFLEIDLNFTVSPGDSTLVFFLLILNQKIIKKILSFY